MKHLLIALPLLAPVAPALAADERPPRMPTRDVAYDAALETDSGPGRHVRSTIKVRYSAAGKRMRVDQAGQPGYMILDPEHGHTILVSIKRRTYTEQPFRPMAHAMFLPSDDFGYTPLGAATVAGQACRLWDMRSATVAGQACVTEDGLLLQVETKDADGDNDDAALTLRATGVTYAPQKPSDFLPPAGFKRVKPAGADEDE